MFHSRIAACVLFFLAVGGGVVALQPTPAQDFPTPGKFHQMLQKTIGTYEGTMGTAGMEPEPAKEMVEGLGGFWVCSRFEADYMGMRFEGRGTMGYDPDKEKFVGTWIDNFTPTISVMEGDYDEAKDAIVMNWMAKDMTGAVVPHRMETVHREDGYSMTMFIGEGENPQVMTVEMKRTSKTIEAKAPK